jgi:hypothetical protein
MKTNQRRNTPKNQSFDYGYAMFQSRNNHGLGFSDHDGGRRGSAKDVKEQKKIQSRKRRFKQKRIMVIDIETDFGNGVGLLYRRM